MLLGDNKLEGSLPSTLSELAPTLKRLSLFKNDIHGTLPELSGLTGLIELTLNSTIIGGTFPTEGLDQLTNLEILDLSFMPGISGSLPPSVGALTSLQEIHLRQTGMSGTLPESIGNLTSLGKDDVVLDCLCIRISLTRPSFTFRASGHRIPWFTWDYSNNVGALDKPP